jgi:hypothetical protein
VRYAWWVCTSRFMNLISKCITGRLEERQKEVEFFWLKKTINYFILIWVILKHQFEDILSSWTNMMRLFGLLLWGSFTSWNNMLRLFSLHLRCSLGISKQHWEVLWSSSSNKFEGSFDLFNHKLRFVWVLFKKKKDSLKFSKQKKNKKEGSLWVLWLIGSMVQCNEI